MQSVWGTGSVSLLRTWCVTFTLDTIMSVRVYILYKQIQYPTFTHLVNYLLHKCECEQLSNQYRELVIIIT